MADFSQLYEEDPNRAGEAANVLADAMRRRRAAGTVASIIGGPFKQAGAAFLGDADQTTDQLARALMFNRQQNLQRDRIDAYAPDLDALAADRAARRDLAARGLAIQEKKLLQPKPVKEVKPLKDMGPASTDALRKEWQATDPFKKTQEVATAAQKILSASESGPGDLSLLYGYMKILDPGSTVREGEFAQAAQTGNLPERIQGWASKVINGEKLPKEVRDQFRREAKAVVRAQKVQYDAMATRYREIAKARGLNPDEVVFDLGLDALSADEAPPAAAPAAAQQRMQGKDQKWYVNDGGGWTLDPNQGPK